MGMAAPNREKAKSKRYSTSVVGGFDPNVDDGPVRATILPITYMPHTVP